MEVNWVGEVVGDAVNKSTEISSTANPCSSRSLVTASLASFKLPASVASITIFASTSISGSDVIVTTELPGKASDSANEELKSSLKVLFWMDSWISFASS